MPSLDIIITGLKWAITLSGLVVFVFATLAWYTAHHERIGLTRIKQNGSLAAAARLHLIVSTTRVVAGAISVGIGIALIAMDDRTGGTLAAAGVLAWNLLVAFHLNLEWRTRTVQRQSVERYDELQKIDELVAQRIERTAERFERTAERLEREQERLERTQERIERTHERNERTRAIAKE
jgi:hypothetical protein